MTSTKILFATGPLGDQRKPGGRVDLLSVRKFRKNWLDEETHEMNKYASNYRVGEVVTYIICLSLSQITADVIYGSPQTATTHSRCQNSADKVQYGLCLI